MTRDEWLEARRKAVGSSDAAAICGLSPFADPYSVYCEKVFGISIPDSPELEWGRRHEPIIAQAFADQTGHEVREARPIIYHPDRPWQAASLDREAIVDGETVPLELKTSSRGTDWGPSGSDAIPEAYTLQVQHQMEVAGAERAFVAVLIGSSDFRIYEIRYDHRLAEKLTQIEESFWRRVEERDPPAPDWSHAAVQQILKRLHVPQPGKEMTIADDNPLAALIRKRKQTTAMIGVLEKRADALRAEIEASMADHSVLMLGDGTKVQRKQVSRSGYTVKPTEYIQLTITGGPKNDERPEIGEGVAAEHSLAAVGTEAGS